MRYILYTANHRERANELQETVGDDGKPVGSTNRSYQLSGKLACLHSIVSGTLTARERIVVVSTSTKTLDLIQRTCEAENWSVARIDGSTDVASRQQLIDDFNNTQRTSVLPLPYT